MNEACHSLHEVVWMQCFEKLWLQPLVVPLIPSFLVHKEFVVPSSHSKSEPGQYLAWSEWWLPVGLRMSAVDDESSAVCNNPDEFVQLGESSCDVFWRL